MSKTIQGKDMGNMKLFILQSLKFGLVGISNSLIAYITFSVLMHFNVPYFYSNLAGYGLGTMNSYIWSQRFVFQKDAGIKNIIKFIISNATVFALSSLLLFVFIDLYGINSQIAYISATAVTMVTNFLFSKFLVFNN